MVGASLHRFTKAVTISCLSIKSQKTRLGACRRWYKTSNPFQHAQSHRKSQIRIAPVLPQTHSSSAIPGLHPRAEIYIAPLGFTAGACPYSPLKRAGAQSV